eukprot:Colp12_sorted_trinity150504_noHs@25818
MLVRRLLGNRQITRLAGSIRFSSTISGNVGEQRGPRVRVNIEGDTGPSRLVCPECNFIYYENPKIIVGTISTFQDKILLVRRNIPPRKGFWALPAGYLESRETTDEGAKRETFEEAGAAVTVDGLLSLYNLSKANQVQLFYKATLASAELNAGPETQEARLFSYEEIPWKELAFPTVSWVIAHYRKWKASGLPANAIPVSSNPDNSTPDVWLYPWGATLDSSWRENTGVSASFFLDDSDKKDKH